jgi:hypothetical protein
MILVRLVLEALREEGLHTTFPWSTHIHIMHVSLFGSPTHYLTLSIDADKAMAIYENDIYEVSLADPQSISKLVAYAQRQLNRTGIVFTKG